MDELITVESCRGGHVVAMKIDHVMYVLFECQYEHEAVGVKTMVQKAVNHLLVFEAEKKSRKAAEKTG